MEQASSLQVEIEREEPSSLGEVLVASSLTSHSSSLLQIEAAQRQETSTLLQIFVVTSVATTIQFGWTLKVSFLTPFVKMHGITHAWSSFLWLSGPISGLVVQPIVGYTSYHCTSRFGRLCPFILGGVFVISISVILIGYVIDIASDIGEDIYGNNPHLRTVAIFAIGLFCISGSFCSQICKNGSVIFFLQNKVKSSRYKMTLHVKSSCILPVSFFFSKSKVDLI